MNSQSAKCCQSKKTVADNCENVINVEAQKCNFLKDGISMYKYIFIQMLIGETGDPWLSFDSVNRNSLKKKIFKTENCK